MRSRKFMSRILVRFRESIFPLWSWHGVGRVAGDVRSALKSANVVIGTVRGTMLTENCESLPQELKTHMRKDEVRRNVD
jgi:hypothetical protein